MPATIVSTLPGSSSTCTRRVAVLEHGSEWPSERVEALKLDTFATEHDGSFIDEIGAALSRAGYRILSSFSVGFSIDVEVAPATAS